MSRESSNATWQKYNSLQLQIIVMDKNWQPQLLFHFENRKITTKTMETIWGILYMEICIYCIIFIKQKLHLNNSLCYLRIICTIDNPPPTLAKQEAFWLEVTLLVKKPSCNKFNTAFSLPHSLCDQSRDEKEESKKQELVL